MPKEGCCRPARAHSHRQMRAARLALGSESGNPPSGRNNFLLSSCVTVTSKGSSPQSPHEEKGCHVLLTQLSGTSVQVKKQNMH